MGAFLLQNKEESSLSSNLSGPCCLIKVEKLSGLNTCQKVYQKSIQPQRWQVFLVGIWKDTQCMSGSTQRDYLCLDHLKIAFGKKAWRCLNMLLRSYLSGC